MAFLLAGCSAAPAEQPAFMVASQHMRQPIPQQELDMHGQGAAVIFIGGFGDEISGIMPHMMAAMPAVAPSETRAYYHWHAGSPQNVASGAKKLAARIRKYRQLHPAAPIVLIGHSMGASLALKVAQALSPDDGSVLLVTLDPADRSCRPERPVSVRWWGNAYVVNSRSGHDYIAEWGGRWNACKQADVNLRFDGRTADEAGCLYIHDNALSLMCSRGAGRHESLYDAVSRILRTESAATPEVDMSRQLLPEGPEDTR